MADFGVGLTGTVGQVFLTKAYAAGMPSVASPTIRALSLAKG